MKNGVLNTHPFKGVRMLKDPCKKYVKEASKKTSIFSKDYWSGAILYIQAAECYRSSGDRENAFKYAMKAADALKKYAGKFGYELVIGDLEKALLIAYNTAKEKDKERLRREVFNIINLRAKHMEMSGNYLGAVDTYKRSIEFAPSGEDALSVLTHAAELLERVIQKKSRLGKDTLVDKLISKLEEIKNLIPQFETAPTKEISKVSEKLQCIATFRYVDIPSEVVKKLENNIKNLPVREVNTIETPEGYEINFIYTSGDPLGKIEFRGGNIIVNLNGNDAMLTLNYFDELRELLANNVGSCRLIGLKIKTTPSISVILKLLDNLQDLAVTRATYGEIAQFINNITNLTSSLSLPGKVKKFIKELDQIAEKAEDELYSDLDLLDADADKIIQITNELTDNLKTLL